MGTFNLAFRYAIGLAGLRTSDVLLTSFPRSGSTWLRFIMANLLAIKDGREEPVDFHDVDRTMVALGRSNLLRAWPHASLPRLVKTHWPYRPLLLRKPDRVVHLVRDPRDVMVSYFHYLKHNQRHSGFETVSALLRDERRGVPAWLRHTVSWLDVATHTVTYEDLRGDTVTTIGTILRHFGAAFPCGEIETAVERASLKRVRRAQQATGIPGPERFDEGFVFARGGRTDSRARELTPDELDYLERAVSRADLPLAYRS